MAVEKLIFERCNMGVIEDYNGDEESIALVFIDADENAAPIIEVPMKKEGALQFAEQVKKFAGGSGIVVAGADEMPKENSNGSDS